MSKILTWMEREYGTIGEKMLTEIIELRAENELLHKLISTMMAIPNMTDKQLDELRSNCKEVMKRTACSCACATGGPCEHKWDGNGVEFNGGRGWSRTCSRCGCTAMSHDLRVMP